MGNDCPRSCANRMAIGAMSTVTDVEKAVVAKLRDGLADLARRGGNPNMISKDDYRQALGSVEIIESDRDILDRLFVMLDRTGEERVNYKEFAVALVPLCSATTADKIQFAFDIVDTQATGRLKNNDVRFVLVTLNAVASYFGDPVLRSTQIDELLDEAVDELNATQGEKAATLPIPELTTFVARHRLLAEFLEGRGTARYGNHP